MTVLFASTRLLTTEQKFPVKIEEFAMQHHGCANGWSFNAQAG